MGLVEERLNIAVNGGKQGKLLQFTKYLCRLDDDDFTAEKLSMPRSTPIYSNLNVVCLMVFLNSGISHLKTVNIFRYDMS